MFVQLADVVQCTLYDRIASTECTEPGDCRISINGRQLTHVGHFYGVLLLAGKLTGAYVKFMSYVKTVAAFELWSV